MTSPTAPELVQQADRVLVVRADDLGDGVMASGFPGAVARAIPGACGFIGPPTAVALMDTTGLAFVAGVDCRPGRRRDVLTAGRRLRAEIDRFAPDVVLLPRFDFEREALAVGLLGPHARPTLTWASDTTPKRHRRDWWLRLLPGPRLPGAGAPLHEFGRLQHFARFVGVDPDDVGPALAVPPLSVPALSGVPGPWVAVAVGAAQGRRRWPLDRYAAVIAGLDADGYTTVLLGSPDEVAQGRQVRERLPHGVTVVDLIGRISLPDTAAVIGRSDLFLGNDSGLGHVAGAVGTSSVIVSCHPAGASDQHINAPERYRPLGDSVVVRPPSPTSATCATGCTADDDPCCVTRVPAEEVLRACRTRLAAAHPAIGLEP